MLLSATPHSALSEAQVPLLVATSHTNSYLISTSDSDVAGPVRSDARGRKNALGSAHAAAPATDSNRGVPVVQPRQHALFFPWTWIRPRFVPLGGRGRAGVA